MALLLCVLASRWGPGEGDLVGVVYKLIETWPGLLKCILTLLGGWTKTKTHKT